MRAVRWLPCAVCLGALCLPAALAVQPSGEKAPLPAKIAVDFAREVAPILRTNCLACHGPEKARGGLRLDTRRGALKGADSGSVLRPGDGAGSRLVDVIAGTAQDGIVMPPKGARLNRQQVALLRAWIDQGAAWPEGLVLSNPAENPASRHWAFQPCRRPPVPTVKRTGWVRNPIDRFILARLEAEDIAPSPEANRATLIRRVSLDLVGLPPAPAEVETFLADNRPDAYERLVDRLLASPHYGEKWARPWLDLCHYADTDGYLTDQARPFAWRYRQWLVDALNRDLPFDRLTLCQLAGDLLPPSREIEVDPLMGTGFLRNTLSNREGGADLEEFRVEQVVDRAGMAGTAWLGLTVGCARCHDHKYDPISQKEFYQFYAFFDAADEVNVDAPLAGELTRYLAKRPEYERKRAELLAPLAKEVARLQVRWEKKLREAEAHPGRDHVWDRQWEVLGLIWGGGFGEGQLEGTQIVLLDPAKRSQDQKDRLLDYFLKQGAVTDPRRFKELKLDELSAKLDRLRAELPKLTRAPVLRRALVPRQAYLHVRGDFRRKGPGVAPGTLAVLPLLPKGSSADRLALARWLVAAENPLTARVTVNRAWQEFFGRGLVLTSEDFGTRGEKPSHPELLDWLAVEFRQPASGGWGTRASGSAPGWSLKALHRLIVTSATYRQSSRARPELATRDPNNRLLARQANLRLSAEQVRDATLTVSGLLDRKVGGPSVFPPQPESVVKEGFDNTWKASTGGDRYRRGLYTYIQRLSPFAQGVTFDAPPLSRTCSRRERSNTPLQALTLLNDPVFFEAAQALAVRVLREKKADAERLGHAFQLCLGRAPTLRERDRLLAYQRQQLALLRAEPNSTTRLFPHKVEGSNAPEGAAWAGVCSVLLNLHEFITRD
ncbi:MAG: PSD1 domain-containing protein [Planctomycetes bacterium]|nr:PSD1 domain-containing protein [Planctomycetota bacterium]